MTATDAAELDAGLLRQAFSSFPTGITAVCTLADGTPAGLAASSFTTVSLTPPLVSVCVQETSTTWPKLRAQSRLGLSVLAEEQEAACRELASKTGDRFANLRWHASDEGAVFILGAVRWFDCSLYSEVPAGDHTIALLEIRRTWADQARAPLVFHGSRYRRLAAAEHRDAREQSFPRAALAHAAGLLGQLTTRRPLATTNDQEPGCAGDWSAGIMTASTNSTM